MPDHETERFAGVPLEPTPQFVDQLRDAVVGEWRGEVTVRTTAAPPAARRRPWLLVAGLGAAAAAVLAVTVVSLGDDGDGTTVPATDPTSGSSLPGTTTPPESTVPITTVPDVAPPAGVAGPLWVVTALGGTPIDGTTDLPWFTVTPTGEVNGYDGCNWYGRSDGQLTTTERLCPVMPDAIAGLPYELAADGTLRAGDVTAVAFSAVNPADADLAKVWHFDGTNSISWNADPTTPGAGSYIAGEPNCLYSGTYRLTADNVQMTPGASSCAATGAFAEWMANITSADTGITLSVHGAELWVHEVNGSVTRLTQG